MDLHQLTGLSIRRCRACELGEQHHGPVPFYGPRKAEVVVIGEAPGRVEDREGRPFCGPAGKVARGWLDSVGIVPDTCAWTNIAQCWPEGPPSPATVRACRPNLMNVLDLYKAPYALVLGATALGALLPFPTALRDLRGLWWKIERPGWTAWAMATYHPAFILRDPGMDTAARADVERFSRSVLLGGLEPPKISDHCTTKGCDRWATKHIKGIGFCDRHKPKVKEPVEQLNLLSI